MPRPVDGSYGRLEHPSGLPEAPEEPRRGRLAARVDRLESFTFEGRTIPLRPGASIAAALTAAGEFALKDSRQDDARGIFCGMGVCQECLVSVDGRPAQRACMTAAQPGSAVARSPAFPDLAVGLGTPATDTALAADIASATGPAPERRRHGDVLVVGGGPGGLAAPAPAAEVGLDVVLLDERAKLGGQYFKQPAGAGSRPPADAQFAAGRALIDRVGAAGVEVRSATSVWGVFGLDAVCAVEGAERVRFSCEVLILAPGAYERGVPFPGWTLPGVMTTGAAQTLWRSYGVVPGKRVLVSGNGPLNMQVAAELMAAGTAIVAVVELAPAPVARRSIALARMARLDPGLIRDGVRYRARLARARVPVLHGAVVTRVQGAGRAETATVASIEASGQLRPGSERRFEVDAVCLGLGFVPSTEIARSLGCRHEYSAAGHLVTVTDACGRTSNDRVWVVGDGSVIRGARHAQAQGELAALDAVRHLGRPVSPALAARRALAERAAARHQAFQDALAEVYRAPHLVDELADADTPICRCEGVTRAAIERTLGGGAGHIGTVKRETRAGMGPCQGRYCGPLIAAMVARTTGVAPGELSSFAPTPPVRPIEIGTLIGPAS